MVTVTVLDEVIGKKLLGELLTIVDAGLGDKVQRDGMKSLVRQSCQKALNELKGRVTAEVGLTTIVEGTKVEGSPKQTKEK